MQIVIRFIGNLTGRGNAAPYGLQMEKAGETKSSALRRGKARH